MDPSRRPASRPTAVFVSFRLGGRDGVSVESEKWRGALAALGIPSRRVAGEIVDPEPHDRVVPSLAIDPPAVAASTGPAGAGGLDDTLASVLSGAEVVVVENLLSLPLNLAAARSLAAALARLGSGGTKVVLHHHDLPWQRERFEHVTDLPPTGPGWVHVTINQRSRAELAERGIEAVTVRNHFDLDPPPGDRRTTREAIGAAGDDLVVLHPVRAIERKNVPGALELCRALTTRLERRVRYWLPGPAEEGYDRELRSVLAGAGVPVVRQGTDRMADAYAACDLVAFPSTWEGFGNPVVESIAHRRPLAVGSYPVLDELRALGLEFLDVGDPAGVAAVVSGAVDITPTMEHNLTVARRHLSLADLPGRLAPLVAGVGAQRP